MILITGATGFLGHNLVPMLLDAGYKVRALVRHSSDTGFLRELGVELVYANDICDAPVVTRACEGCRAVVHAAGLFRFWGHTNEFWQTNVGGTATILAAAEKAGVQRFVHISTIAVVGRTPRTRPIDETTPCFPQEPYQRTKFEGEQLALSYYRERGLPVIVLRPGAFYGPWGRYAFNRLFFEEPLRGWRIKVDNGRHITFPVFVPDVAQGIIRALDKGRPGEIYNICGHSLTHNEINAIVSDLAGIGHWRINIPRQLVLALARTWTAVSRFTGQEPFYPINMAPYVFQDWHVSITKAQQELGFEPTPFAIGARATLEWYWEQGILKRKKK
ncbi:MAG: NAD-dependent epimerase/dehydratase family protein [Chloroflexi bacterium]|nr:MAG: NAD-dependent epimerase/dehydratase family protein [Chloroflexota bacterium]